MTLRSAISSAFRWFAGLPLTIIATHSLLAVLVLSSTEAAGWNDWGHEGLLFAILPILGWLILQLMTSRR